MVMARFVLNLKPVISIHANRNVTASAFGAELAAC